MYKDGGPTQGGELTYQTGLYCNSGKKGDQ